MVENYERQVRSVAHLGDHSVPCARLETGTHLFASAFGCEAKCMEGSSPCALPRVHTAQEADQLPAPDIWKSPTLYRVFELAHAVQHRLGPNVCLSPPDMQSGFDTAALIWNKEDFLCAMMDPEGKAAVKRLVHKCTHLLKTFLREFRKEFPQCSPCHCPTVWAPPEMGPWVSNDECGSFGTPLFEEFCLPELVDLAETFCGLGMHCCAEAEHQFESFKRIPGFYAFNRVAGQRGYQTILDHFAGKDAPIHVLAWITEEDIQRLLSHAPQETRFIFVLSGAAPEEARSWLERVRRMSTVSS